MARFYKTFSRFTRSTVAPPVLVLRDLARQLAQIVPDVWDRIQFRRFWGDGSLLTDVYFVMDSYEGVSLRNRFRREEALAGRDFLQTLAANAIVDGSFSPHAAAMLSALFLRHGGSAPHIVSDTELNPAQDATVICYGTSDSNYKIFDIEALSGGSLCQFLFDAAGQRSFRLAEQVFSIECRDGVTYDKAIVLRVTNKNQSNHSHVVCAGLSEWGSLAAAYYLTTRWKELHKRYDAFGQRRDFCVLLEVPCGQFQNAREIISAVSWESESAPGPILASSQA